MNSKHQKTISAIYNVSRSITFRDVSSLLVALGCEVKQGNGSRIRFIFGQRILTMHEPHPGREIKEYQVKMVRDFLIAIGVK